MTKITGGFKHFNLMVAIIVILAAGVAGCVDSKNAPQLVFTAKAASGLLINHAGGDVVVLKDMKITVKKEIDNKVVDGLSGIPLFGGMPEFQDAPAVETLSAGATIRHTWKSPLSIGDVLVITVQDTASGKVVVETRVAVT